MEDFTDLLGYQFSWGSISESYLGPYVDEFGTSPESAIFEVLPEKLLKQHPNPDYWKTEMVAMCNVHPLASKEFRATKAVARFHVLRFRAEADSVARLRSFIMDTFLPTILPEILARGEQMIDDSPLPPTSMYGMSCGESLGLRPMGRAMAGVHYYGPEPQTTPSDYGHSTPSRSEMLARYLGRWSRPNLRLVGKKGDE